MIIPRFTAGDGCNISSCLCNCEWKMLTPMKWTCVFLSPDLFLSCLCQPFYQICCWLRLQLLLAQAPSLGMMAWLWVTADLTECRSQILDLKALWLCGNILMIFFCYISFFFFFWLCLRTIPIIYVLHDTFVNTINKPFLVSLCNDECSSSSNCYHVYRSLFYYWCLPHMLCRWEESGFAVLFEIR